MKRAGFNVTVFFGILYAGLVLLILLPRKDFSEQEKRYLSEKPELSPESVLDGRYMAEAELWITDHMPFREAFRSLYAGVMYAGGRRRIEGIYAGRDGFLMEALSEEELSGSLFRTNIEALSSFCEMLSEASIPVHVMLVPPSAATLSEKLPMSVPIYDRGTYETVLRERLSDAYLELTSVLTEEDYFRTDHHWTADGAYKAYCLWRGRGIDTPVVEGLTRCRIAESFFGTFYAKAPLPWLKGDSVEAYVYKPSVQKLRVTADGRSLSGLYDEAKLGSRNDAYTFFLGGNYGELVIQNEEAGGGRLLIIKDSFANCFIPYAAMDFSRVHAIDLRFFNGSVAEYVRENAITEVLVLYGFNEFSRDRNVWKIEEDQ